MFVQRKQVLFANIDFFIDTILSTDKLSVVLVFGALLFDIRMMT